MPRATERAFPNLTDYVVASPKDARYNCIAFAAGDTSKKWDPGALPGPGYYWPPGAELGEDDDHIDALKRAFAMLGYTECRTGDLEPGYQKVALYAITEDDWLHAAVQEMSGAWGSKLGASYDIRHATPQCLEGPTYGKVVCFMRRRYNAGTV